jgi:hypothetical protein
LAGAFKAVLEESGGDIDLALSVLSANAIKHGAARDVLKDQFSKFFETTVEQDLEQKPVKTLAAINTRFVK